MDFIFQLRYFTILKKNLFLYYDCTYIILFYHLYILIFGGGTGTSLLNLYIYMYIYIFNLYE